MGMMKYNKEWEYGAPVDCDCANNFLHIERVCDDECIHINIDCECPE